MQVFFEPRHTTGSAVPTLSDAASQYAVMNNLDTAEKAWFCFD
jgi:hypothetical protein